MFPCPGTSKEKHPTAYRLTYLPRHKSKVCLKSSIYASAFPNGLGSHLAGAPSRLAGAL